MPCLIFVATYIPVAHVFHADAVPAALQDDAGHACLLVLPSDQPSNRREAAAVETLLVEMLQAGLSVWELWFGSRV